MSEAIRPAIATMPEVDAIARQMTGRAHDFSPSTHTARVTETDMPGIQAMDRACCGQERNAQLTRWITAPDAIALASHSQDGAVTGFAVAHPDADRYWIGPVSADDGDIASNLLRDLSAALAGKTIQMLVPEPNQVSLLIATELALSESGPSAPIPEQALADLPWEKIFALTPMELD